MLNKFLKILFPEPCPVCKKPATDHKTAPICSDCWQAILPYKGPRCRKCGKPLVSEVSLTCGACIKDAPDFEWVRGFGLYDGTLKKAINLFKYYRTKRLAKPLTELMFTQLDNKHLTESRTKIASADVIIPVPLFKKRLRQREFNQSGLLAKHLAYYTGTTLETGCLLKVRDTLPQVGLNAKERQKNIRNAFGIHNKTSIQNKNIMLVDDVFTTGATVRECCKLLKKAGAGDIYVVTLAHSPGDF